MRASTMAGCVSAAFMLIAGAACRKEATAPPPPTGASLAAGSVELAVVPNPKKRDRREDDVTATVLSDGTVKIGGKTLSHPGGVNEDAQALKPLISFFKNRREGIIVSYALEIRADRRVAFEHVARLMMIACMHGGVSRIVFAVRGPSGEGGVILSDLPKDKGLSITESSDLPPQVRVFICADPKKRFDEMSENPRKHEGDVHECLEKGAGETCCAWLDKDKVYTLRMSRPEENGRAYDGLAEGLKELLDKPEFSSPGRAPTVILCLDGAVPAEFALGMLEAARRDDRALVAWRTISCLTDALYGRPSDIEIERPKGLEYARKFLDVEKSVEDPIFRRAEEFDHNETEDDDPQSMKGASTDFKNDKPFRGLTPEDSDAPRHGGKKNLVNRGGGSQETEGAVLVALKWLARHQNEDGSWSIADYGKRCGRLDKYKGTTCEPTGLQGKLDAKQFNFDAGATGLALLAFLGAGYTHASKETYEGICFGDVVKHGLAHLLHNQDMDGCFGPRDGDHYMYNHAIAALAMSEAHGLTGMHKFKEPAQKGIDFLIDAQTPGKGWGGVRRAAADDTSILGWAVMALKSADVSGLSFDKTAAYDGARAWLDSVTAKSESGGKTVYKTRYRLADDADVFVPGVNEGFKNHPTATGIMALSRIFMDKKRTAEVTGGADLLAQDLPRWDGKSIDFFYWYVGTMALYQCDGPDGAKWREWNKAMVDALVENQNAAAAEDKIGSWEPVDRWSCGGGRVYATAINALTLEVYYRYASVFNRKSND